MKQIYKLSEIVFSVENPFEIENYSKAVIFQENKAKEVFSCSFEYRNDISEILKNCSIIYQTSYYFILKNENSFLKAFHHGGNIYAITMFNEMDRKSVCYYSDFNIMHYKIQHGFTAMMYIELERILLMHNSFVLHSSYIYWKQHAILFSAPSGTGKSTQADLWEKYENAEIVNGDRAAIRKIEGKWRAYGLPMCGTSNICKNISSPIAAIVIIRQSLENSILELNGLEIFKAIYSEITINRWNEAYVEKIVKLIQEISKEVLVLQLNCTKEREAVSVLKKYLFERRII